VWSKQSSAPYIQLELRTRNPGLPPDRAMEFRIGINIGDVIVEGEKIYGDEINIAARLKSLAEPRGVCISGTVYDQVENKLRLGYEYLGEQDRQEHREAGAGLPRMIGFDCD
jgi:adenylate cyclase